MRQINGEHLFLFVLEISERPSRRSTSSTFRHQGVEHEVNNEIKDENKDTAAPCALLMLFECWVSLKHPLALHYSLSTDFYWHSTYFYRLSTDFYWLSTDSLPTLYWLNHYLGNAQIEAVAIAIAITHLNKKFSPWTPIIMHCESLPELSEPLVSEKLGIY